MVAKAKDRKRAAGSCLFTADNFPGRLRNEFVGQCRRRGKTAREVTVLLVTLFVQNPDAFLQTGAPRPFGNSGPG